MVHQPELFGGLLEALKSREASTSTVATEILVHLLGKTCATPLLTHDDSCYPQPQFIMHLQIYG